MNTAAVPQPQGKPPRRFTAVWLPIFLFFVLAAIFIQGVWAPVIIQVSGSLERGIYLRTSGPVEPGHFVSLIAPDSVSDVLTAHGFRPQTRLLKTVAATEGDYISSSGQNLLINGEPAGVMHQVSSAGIELPRHRTNTVLEPQQVWVLGVDADSSVDSRCFGAVEMEAARGPYALIWSFDGGRSAELVQ